VILLQLQKEASQASPVMAELEWKYKGRGESLLAASMAAAYSIHVCTLVWDGQNTANCQLSLTGQQQP
jgi:hypothetical protein